jgi:hypothetical protein
MMRQRVADVEVENERDIGGDALKELRQLLVALSSATFLQDYLKQTDQPRSWPRSGHPGPGTQRSAVRTWS